MSEFQVELGISFVLLHICQLWRFGRLDRSLRFGCSSAGIRIRWNLVLVCFIARLSTVVFLDILADSGGISAGIIWNLEFECVVAALSTMVVWHW